MFRRTEQNGGSGVEDKQFVNVTGHLMTGSSLSPSLLAPSAQEKKRWGFKSSEEASPSTPVDVWISVGMISFSLVSLTKLPWLDSQ